MTREEVVEMFEGGVLKFVSYHKYEFMYEAQKDGVKVRVIFGGDDIYHDSFGAIELFDKKFLSTLDWSFEMRDQVAIFKEVLV